jgi:hypothetical protein
VLNAGTTLYTHRESNVRNIQDMMATNSRSNGEKNICYVNNMGSDLSKWYTATSIGNIYNRLVVYDASYFHGSTKNFGTCKEDSRLIQVFFFYTKNADNNENIKAIEYRTNEFLNHTNISTVSNTSGFLNKLAQIRADE